MKKLNTLMDTTDTLEKKNAKKGKLSLVKLFASFFKVGLIGFGGGSALIPVVEKELVQNRKAMDGQDYLKHTVVANITPGALPVKLGATCGYQLGGVLGSIIGAFATALPGVLLTIALVAMFSALGAGAVDYVRSASVGISSFIVFLLISYVLRTVRSGNRKVNLLLCIVAFLLTGGKEIREVAGELLSINSSFFGTPIFDISTIDLIILSFYLILLSTKLKNKFEWLIAIATSIIYAFVAGKFGQALGLAGYKTILLLFMIGLLVALYVVRREKSQDKTKISFPKAPVILAALFVLVPVVMGALTHLYLGVESEHTVMEFLGQAGISTVTSFGGGEAYVSVADGVFVQSGYIDSDIYYTRLVPIANALPGPILVKIAAGIGFTFGEQVSSTALGWIISVITAALTIGLCSAIAVVVMQLYDSVSQWQFIIDLKKYILPVICGMLISTSCAMIYESMKITSEAGIAGFVSFPVIATSILGISFIHKKFRVHDVFMLLGMAALSLITLKVL
ncbi:MAG: chromate transporter [Eubacteriales bacterium]|jgi:chromate transporter